MSIQEVTLRCTISNQSTLAREGIRRLPIVMKKLLRYLLLAIIYAATPQGHAMAEGYTCCVDSATIHCTKSCKGYHCKELTWPKTLSCTHQGGLPNVWPPGTRTCIVSREYNKTESDKKACCGAMDRALGASCSDAAARGEWDCTISGNCILPITYGYSVSYKSCNMVPSPY